MLITLLVAIGVTAATAASAVIIFRGFMYLLSNILGGNVVTSSKRINRNLTDMARLLNCV